MNHMVGDIGALFEHVLRIRDLWADEWDGRWSSNLYCRGAVPTLVTCVDAVLMHDAARSLVMADCAALRLYAASGDDKACIATLTTIAARLSDRLTDLEMEEMSRAA